MPIENRNANGIVIVKVFRAAPIFNLMKRRGRVGPRDSLSLLYLHWKLKLLFSFRDWLLRAELQWRESELKCVKINYCLLENVLKGGQMEIKLDWCFLFSNLEHSALLAPSELVLRKDPDLIDDSRPQSSNHCIVHLAVQSLLLRLEVPAVWKCKIKWASILIFIIVALDQLVHSSIFVQPTPEPCNGYWCCILHLHEKKNLSSFPELYFPATVILWTKTSPATHIIRNSEGIRRITMLLFPLNHESLDFWLRSGNGPGNSGCAGGHAQNSQIVRGIGRL